jgi:hypothetical protein
MNMVRLSNQISLQVRPHIPELQNLELNLNDTSNSDNTISLSNINIATLAASSSNQGKDFCGMWSKIEGPSLF